VRGGVALSLLIIQSSFRRAASLDVSRINISATATTRGAIVIDHQPGQGPHHIAIRDSTLDARADNNTESPLSIRNQDSLRSFVVERSAFWCDSTCVWIYNTTLADGGSVAVRDNRMELVTTRTKSLGSSSRWPRCDSSAPGRRP
jgi:hypothetical protein